MRGVLGRRGHRRSHRRPGQRRARLEALARDCGLGATAVGLVSVVGGGAAVRERAAAALRDAGIAAQAWLAAHEAVAAVVAAESCDDAVRCLHRALLEPCP